MSLALARKYRPATFDDLIGQETVSQTLCLALDAKRLSHAYLFSGLRGSGKTSTARIFAKALLCEKGETSHPCGECSHCVMASQNSHMDIIEMDGASNRGIDDIKDLIEHTKYNPSTARYKIFIIDEVHMLTPQAFNALLKTLEEPPSFVKFILATTDPLKLPATILSRTQHFRFKKIPQNLVLSHLEHILNLENIGYEPEAIDIIARSGAGSLRDSLTLLDQAIVYSKNFVDMVTVTGMLGIIEPSLLEALLHDILNKESEKILAFINTAKAYEAQMILDEFTLYLKGLLLSGSALVSPMIIERFFRVIAESKSLLAQGSDGEFVLCLALFKMIEALEIKDIDTMIAQLEQELQGAEVASKPIIPTTIATASSTTPAIPTPTPQATPKEQPQPINIYEKKFEMLIKKIYDRDYDLGECFSQNITFESFEANALTWSSSAQDEDKKILRNHWTLINTFVKDIFGYETKIINRPKPQEKPNPSIPQASLTTDKTPYQDTHSTSKVEGVEMKSSCIAPEAGETEAAKEKEPSSLLEEPMIKEAIALFDPQKVRIKRNS